MKAPVGLLVAALVVSAAPTPPRAAQAPAPAAPAETVVIDAEVIDETGHPIPGLAPDQFDVTISGRPQRVVSAQFVDATRSAPGVPPAFSGADAAGGRTFVFVIDLKGFVPLEAVAIVVSAQGLIDKLGDNDRIAVVTYPNGASLDPTTDRAAVRKALETAITQDPLVPAAPETLAPLKPPDLADDTRQSLGSLHGIIRRLAQLPGRKVVVLVSPGIAAVPPDTADLTARIGEQAAASNAVIYALYVDHGFIDLTIPEKQRIALTSPTRGVEQNVLVRWLDRIATPAGGAVFRVAGVNPDPLYVRLSNETSGYYLIGVDAAGLENNAVRELSVKVRTSGLSVRAHHWVPTARRAPAAPVAGAGTTVDPSASPPPAMRPPAAPTVSDPILAAFERGEYATVQERLQRVPELPKWIRDFRGGPRRWPAEPRRAMVFALDLTLASLASPDPAARDELVKLLLEQAAALRTPESDTFECLWFWGALTLFEGSEHPEAALPLASRAKARCPSHSRIVLANAVLADERSPVLVGGIRVGSAAAAEAAAHAAVLVAYQAAMTFPDVEAEARARQAWFLFRLKRYDEALAVLADPGSPPAVVPALDDTVRRQIDQQVRYIGYLVQGHILRALGRAEPAADAYRRAMETWPGAQAARLALMTLLGTQGKTTEAASLALAIESAPDDAVDPWWWFWQGDRVLYPAVVTRLRDLVR